MARGLISPADERSTPCAVVLGVEHKVRIATSALALLGRIVFFYRPIGSFTVFADLPRSLLASSAISSFFPPLHVAQYFNNPSVSFSFSHWRKLNGLVLFVLLFQSRQDLQKCA